jgi:hypothetical protein
MIIRWWGLIKAGVRRRAFHYHYGSSCKRIGSANQFILLAIVELAYAISKGEKSGFNILKISLPLHVTKYKYIYE